MRRLMHSFLALTLILSLVSPAGASVLDRDDDSDMVTSVPVVIDALVLRPMGLAMTAVGLVVYAFPVAPMVLLTRPGDVWKPFGPLVAKPGKFTFADPLGQH